MLCHSTSNALAFEKPAIYHIFTMHIDLIANTALTMVYSLHTQVVNLKVLKIDTDLGKFVKELTLSVLAQFARQLWDSMYKNAVPPPLPVVQYIIAAITNNCLDAECVY